MSAAPGSQEPGYTPNDKSTPSSAGTTLQNAAKDIAQPANNTTTQDRRGSVDKYGDVMKRNSIEAHSHSHSDQNPSKPGVIGSLFSSYVKGGK